MFTWSTKVLSPSSWIKRSFLEELALRRNSIFLFPSAQVNPIPLLKKIFRDGFTPNQIFNAIPSSLFSALKRRAVAGENRMEG